MQRPFLLEGPEPCGPQPGDGILCLPYPDYFRAFFPAISQFSQNSCRHKSGGILVWGDQCNIGHGTVFGVRVDAQLKARLFRAALAFKVPNAAVPVLDV